MKKLVLIGLLAILASSIPVSIVSATDNVTAISTDNFTANVTVIMSDNLTLNQVPVIISDNISLNIQGVTELTDAVNNFTDILETEFEAWLGIFLLIGIAFLAFIGKDPLIYGVVGFLFMLAGFPYWATSHNMSIALVVIGIAIFFKAFTKGKAKE